MRDQIINELKTCWEEGAYLRMLPPEPRPRGTLLDLSELVLGRYIRSLEPLRADFSHVTRLNLSGTRLSDRDISFLDNFPNVRALDLSDNGLGEIPSQLPKMKGLTHLNLSENSIVWLVSDYQTLEQCTHLRSLNMEGNLLLEVPPNIRQMQDLRRLVLRRTGITQWPVGLESPRATFLELDMTNTPVSTVPEFAQGSQAAETVANAWLDRTKLGNLDEDRFVSYRRSFGLDPYRTAPFSGKVDSRYWTANMTEEERTEVQTIWDDLEKEHGSQGFFNVIKLLKPEGFQTDVDTQLFKDGREDLTLRVLQLLYAMDENPQFRDRMFSLAAVPPNCGDAGANTFNTLGVETLLENILKDDTPQGLLARESHLVTLAKQSWHLDQVKEYARSDIKRRTDPISKGGLGQAFGSAPGQVDEVEVHLAYQTSLKRRLDLPWLSEHMIYRDTARVTSGQIENAALYVLDRETDNGLVDGVLEKSFWSNYLHDNYLEAFNTQHELRETASNQLVDLLEAQEEWASPQVAPQRKAALHEQLITLANELVIPHTVVFADEPLSEVTVRRLYENIEHDYKELGRRLTRQALQNAGL